MYTGPLLQYGSGIIAANYTSTVVTLNNEYYNTTSYSVVATYSSTIDITLNNQISVEKMTGLNFIVFGSYPSSPNDIPFEWITMGQSK